MTVDRTDGAVSQHTLVPIWLCPFSDPLAFLLILISVFDAGDLVARSQISILIGTRSINNLLSPRPLF
ncbi:MULTISPECIES: hypothetical protein [unclassified Microcoleus]|uniref:hypothetical protein n=1 Tax=unclassified Microcoleus TaxID=2642155 RepID=UPI002FD0ACF9